MEGCLNSGINPSKVEIELSEEKALEQAIQNAEKDDIIIVFYEEYYPLVQIIDRLSTQQLDKRLITA
jgi:cyanophycin synthetase